ncbi:kinesin-like protein NACK2 isoform X1 [Gastrolobium bilobum]|uniref:kinesin-like protein NACK2 isoform X1 n=1 Tax=Gastrolobium bilobum TaxID=150636 RepID=UPI002AB08D8A|nr:kinesin-like protein NACK2 isoform X1 [Gastrolobium bilobum]
MVGTSATPLSKIQRTPSGTPGGPKIREEKIRVTVRMRPLNRKEQAMYDLIAWDCLDEQAIVFKNPNQERAASLYTFDKVFAPTCSTQKVYEEGAKDVALSALSGINATIFAYGQTSSGKTFTMRGITENAIKDIYEHIKNTPERDFILRISALEIYNETVIDLLNRESGPLRLLDDPEKGTIVEKLNEEVAKDGHHLRHLIGICEAQRQVGETTLNDKSSRSHQIIRLTVESILRERSGHVKSFLASLNFVDLAGSERISQANTCGARLKEGSHINRSLLTLASVIRKLSGGKRGHIPYRDSKLTRILQSSLGGNARTAIICTISPSLSHVEQTRNTLTFATSAKEVVNTARVNMVVSDKTLVRQLQKEVARLEGELRSPELSSDSCLRSLLAEKELKIQQMERDIEDLRRQRDLAQSQLELEKRANKVRKGSNDHGPSSQVARCLSFPEENESKTPGRKAAVGRQAMLKNLLAVPDPSILVGEIRKLEHRQLQLCEDANRALEVLHKDFATHKLGNEETAETMSKVLSEIKELVVASSTPEEIVAADKANLMEKFTQLKYQGNTIASLERKLENVQKSIDKLVSAFSTEETLESKTPQRRKKILPFTLSNSPNMQHIIRAPCSPLSSSCKAMEHEIENRVPENNIAISDSDNFARLHKDTPRKDDESCDSILSRDGSPAARQSKSVNVKKIQKMFKNAAEENIRSFRVYVTELKELVAKLHYQKQLLVCQVLELEANKSVNEEMDTTDGSPLPWHILFEQQRKQIIMLWHLCHISIVHRTQFYLLLRGDPSDQIYMEVELRRLTWLEQHLAELGNASPALLGDEPASSVSASIRALKQEREYLAKRVNAKLTADERELLYAKWEVPPVGKQRRLQLVNKLWTDPYNMQHVQESAEIVARLIDFCASDENSKDMFELNFASPSNKKTWGWNLISNLLNL